LLNNLGKRCLVLKSGEFYRVVSKTLRFTSREREGEGGKRERERERERERGREREREKEFFCSQQLAAAFAFFKMEDFFVKSFFPVPSV
jgi:hypothetical protein